MSNSMFSLFKTSVGAFKLISSSGTYFVSNSYQMMGPFHAFSSSAGFLASFAGFLALDI
jgi:hypothetical protein